jgi:hypothetical protein
MQLEKEICSWLRTRSSKKKSPMPGSAAIYGCGSVAEAARLRGPYQLKSLVGSPRRWRWPG